MELVRHCILVGKLFLGGVQFRILKLLYVCPGSEQLSGWKMGGARGRRLQISKGAWLELAMWGWIGVGETHVYHSIDTNHYMENVFRCVDVPEVVYTHLFLFSVGCRLTRPSQ